MGRATIAGLLRAGMVAAAFTCAPGAGGASGTGVPGPALPLSLGEAVVAPSVRGPSGRDTYRAVGRVDFRARPDFCSGTMVAPDLVLTAAHCVHERSGRLMEPASLTFRLGLQDGVALAERGVRRVVPHPGYAAVAGDRSRRLAVDAAFLELDEPVGAQVAAPAPFGPAARTGEVATLAAYVVGRGRSPEIRRHCPVVDRRGPLAIIDCEVRSGASGSPVLLGGEVAGVAIARGADGRAIAVAADAVLPALRAALTAARAADPAPP